MGLIDPRIRKAIDYIHANWSEKILLRDLSRECGLSLYHLVYLFRKQIGVSFKTYLKHLRIEQAKKLLEDPFLNVTQIAHQIGYCDLANFDNDFKKITRLTPTAYRKRRGAKTTRFTKETPRKTKDFPSFAKHN